MKKKEFDEDNKKYIKETLAQSKTITKSVNIFMNQNKLNVNNNSQNQNNSNDIIKNSQNKRNSIFSKNKKNINDSDEDIEEEKNNIDDEDDEGIFTYEYVTKNIERYQKKVTKFDEQVKKNLLLSKQHPDKKDEYKTEAIRALKKKKFYSKALERYENKKMKLEIKNLDKEYQMQKKELKKLTRKLKKKVRMVTLGEEYDEDDEDSENSDEENDVIFSQIDLDDNTLEQQYEQIINSPEIKHASENLNLFKFIFQEE